MKKYLEPTAFIDSDHPTVIAFAQAEKGDSVTKTDQAVSLYYAVRDGFKYNPYRIDVRKEGLTASNLIGRDDGYCTEKAVLLAASARAIGIPSRLGFAKVKNHLGTSRLEELLRTDMLVFHGYCELYLEDQWVKATPAFNLTLCEKFGVAPLEFDGKTDSVFQEFTGEGAQYMEYLHDYGTFDDLPHELYLSELQEHYPHLFKYQEYESGDFYFVR
jgi:transglutaminase-like putative cysteine protease